MKIIVDLFNQHSGDINELKRLSLLAFQNGADVAKIQVLDSQRIWGDNSRKYLEINYDQFAEIADYSRSIGIEFLATIFNEEHLEWLDKLGIENFKIASVTSKFKTSKPKLDKILCDEIIKKNKNTYISLGLEKQNYFPFGFKKNINYLYCVSKYPTLLDDPELKKMPLKFKKNGFFGYSDHTLGLAAGIKAYMRGAKVLEKHFTSSKTFQKTNEKGHLCSFDPDELRIFKNIINELKILDK